jgi:hypothetical protein
MKSNLLQKLKEAEQETQPVDPFKDKRFLIEGDHRSLNHFALGYPCKYEGHDGIVSGSHTGSNVIVCLEIVCPSRFKGLVLVTVLQPPYEGLELIEQDSDEGRTIYIKVIKQLLEKQSHFQSEALKAKK